MLVWLASYPRSGNTLTRLMLASVFDVKSSSVYDESMWTQSRFAERFGLIAPSDALKEDAQNRLVAIKTHDLPPDANAAISIVRDPRAVFASVWHYLRDFHGIEPAIEDVIAGKHWPGSWSEHDRAWDPRRRPRTILIKYEELLEDPDGVCADVTDAFRIPPRRDFENDFEAFHAVDSRFFRRGNNAANIDETKPYSHMIAELHGEVMRELGYL